MCYPTRCVRKCQAKKRKWEDDTPEEYTMQYTSVSCIQASQAIVGTIDNKEPPFDDVLLQIAQRAQQVWR